ncbi:MAG: glycosyltransferase [Beijerinckiaceae bacterium]|nr:glycosyltransferase [Beijerinckiaceae bacterium]MCZ8298789.1 glycosyltransferase [Beijerinckiaceae bacterium]
MSSLDILFVHNNFPAQFRNLAEQFASFPGIRVRAIGAMGAPSLPGIETVRYGMRPVPRARCHPFAQRFDLECRRAEMVLYEAIQLRQEGFSPRVIYVHPGWGEALPLRSVFPHATICSYAEFYYAARGRDVGFDTEFDTFGVDGDVRITLRNAGTLLSLAEADYAISPMRWQKSVFPPEFHPKIHVVHDGMDFGTLTPDHSNRGLSIQGLHLTAEDEVITFVSRNLEPYRGFHIFMRALPEILKARPRAHVLILGDDGVSYGAPPREHGSWRMAMLAEIAGQIDFQRVHFLGWTHYDDYLAVLRRSDAHIYLTYPFVLSWSMLEAMAMECLIIGSDTAPVSEVVTAGYNGLLVPFFSPKALSDLVTEALANPKKHARLRKAARTSVVTRYDFKRNIWPKHVDLLRRYCRDEALIERVQGEAIAQPVREDSL